MKILLIDNYDSFTYNIVELLRKLKTDNLSIFKNDEINTTDAAQFDKIIISPGPATPKESGNILDIIDKLSPTHSIFGICLGHQAIAEAFGATLRNVPHPYHGIQTEIDILKTHKIFSSINEKRIKVGLYHSWTVDENNLPDYLEVTSRSAENNIMSIRHKTYDVHGVQFHPESYMTEFGKEIMKSFLH